MQKGCVVFYAVIDGEEKVIEFFTENDIFSDYFSYLCEVPAKAFMRATEDCIIISVKKSDFLNILKKSKKIKLSFHKIFQIVFLI